MGTVVSVAVGDDPRGAGTLASSAVFRLLQHR
jgi:hypothetical protein